MPEIKPFKIRDIEINPPLILSPMAGVTDVSFRRLLRRRGGVGLSVSEFISVEGLTRSNPKSKRQMRFYEDERPFAVQIFGGQPERMRMAAEMAEEVGADILDVNCGCPAPKVVKHGGGSGLLKDHSRLETILKEIKKAIRIPLTVRFVQAFTTTRSMRWRLQNLLKTAASNTSLSTDERKNKVIEVWPIGIWFVTSRRR